MKHVDLEGATISLSGMVDEDVDLDGQFTLICDDTGERLTVNGWQFSIYE
jgi:hypothetical protein